MAKKINAISKSTTTSPSTLTMKLFDPGMTAMHRAGLGGLACSLRYIEDNAQSLLDDQLPGGPWEDNRPPWKVETEEITLDFGTPAGAAEFLKRLFLLSFQVTDAHRVIYLPGQFTTTPSIGVLADMQSAVILTFLQHGLTRKLAKTSKILQIDAEGDGSKIINIEFKDCESYKHQGGWEALVEKSGSLRKKPVEVIGPINPGAVVRHVAYSSTTKMEDPVERVLPLYFAMVGTLALPINHGVGVLIVPEVDDLVAFQMLRPLMSPRNARDCKIAGASDAAFQCQLRLKAAKEIAIARIPACTAILFRSTPWASQQKSRVDAIEIPRGDEKTLRVFEQAVQQLPPRVSTAVGPKDKSQSKKSKVLNKKKPNDRNEITTAPEYFWSDSVVRPLVADNLARGQPWYRGFYDLMTKLDPVSKKPKRLKLSFEKAGLKNMIDNIEWNDTGEKVIVLAVHQAIKQRLGQIAGENKGKQGVMKNRMQGEFDKWRLAFSGSKTADQFRQSLCDLFGRAGINPVLKEHWASILPWLSSPTKWQLARDLSLLALASYTGTGVNELEPPDENETGTHSDQ
jgi:CRISPR-associated protein Cas8a1/Csx13